MERLLEGILAVEREAARLEDDAGKRFLELEQEYRLALAHLENESTRRVQEQLEAKRRELLASLDSEIEKIREDARKTCDRIEAAALARREEALALVLSTLLPTGGKP